MMFAELRKITPHTLCLDSMRILNLMPPCSHFQPDQDLKGLWIDGEATQEENVQALLCKIRME